VGLVVIWSLCDQISTHPPEIDLNMGGWAAVDGDGPRFGAMIGLVAVVVATVILVFFGIGYALGRLFL
jgi:hypothetical protein